MNPSHDSNNSSFGQHWLHQYSSAAPEHYADVQDTSSQTMGYSFAPSTQAFGLRDGFDDSPGMQPSVSPPSAMTSASTVQPILLSSTDFNKTSRSQSDQFHEQPMHPPPPPQKSTPRTRTLTPSDWEKYHDEIKKLWKDQGRPLKETKKVMRENFGFTASVEQYKKQFKTWNWSKYLPAEEAAWMNDKAAKRKREEKKDTVFTFRGQTYTTESLHQRLQRRKTQMEETIASADAPTPKDIEYETPRNNVTSPLYVASPKVQAPQSRWTPTSSSNTNHPHQLNLMWNGRTKTDLDAVYKEAQGLERLEMIGDAEQKFREALDGFEKLLSATHEDTIAVAYRLASFYAQNDRMKDADAVLDWMTETHAKCFGKRGLQTMQHILHIVELFCNWNRNEDAKAFLSRIIDVVEEEDGDTENDLRSLLNSGSASAMLDMSRIEVIPGQPQNSRDPALTINRDSEPVAIDLQLGVAAGYVKTNDKAAEPFLLRLIEQCEKHPKDLAVQTLRCRNALLELYHKNNREKMNEALDQSKQTFWRVMNSAQEKTQPLFDAGEETAKWHVKAGQYDTADEIFVQIQSDAVETFGEDNGKIISLFRSIGLCYQKEGRWEDAEPWFEQALVACYRTLEEDSNITKRLEAALENQHYDM